MNMCLHPDENRKDMQGLLQAENGGLEQLFSVQEKLFLFSMEITCTLFKKKKKIFAAI